MNHTKLLDIVVKNGIKRKKIVPERRSVTNGIKNIFAITE